MNKQQRKWCEYKLTTLFRQLDKMDSHMEKAEMDGDMERYAKAEKRYDLLSAEIDGIQAVLYCLGYHSRVNDEWNRVDVLANN